MPISSGSALDLSRSSRIEVADRVSRLELGRIAYLEVEALNAGGWSTVIPTDDGELWMISSGWPVNPGQTVYLGGFVDSRIEGAQTPVPEGTVKGMWFSADGGPGVGETFTYTLMKNGVATACTFQLTGSQRKGKSTVEVACADQDEICVRVVASGGAAEAIHNGSVHFVPDAI